jgi:carboxylesterase type B
LVNRYDIRTDDSFSTGNLGKIDATADSARGCPQFYTQINQPNFLLSLFSFIYGSPPVQALLNYGEDCLTVDVLRPAGTTSSDKLPVLFWIPGGGFQFGATNSEDGTPLVQKSAELGQPFIYVAVNYRLGAFGFLGGNELADEGSTNLGLKDQRLAMEWVAENIAAFGGDPDKVTIWGQSAGAMSTFDHLIIHEGDNTYNGKPLFRGAVMNSGAMIPVNSVRDPKAQSVFENIADAAHCGDAADKLDCMRKADYTTFLYASSSVPALLSYRTIDVSFAPRPDGDFYPQSPELALAQGKFTKVPIITGKVHVSKIVIEPTNSAIQVAKRTKGLC